MANNNKNCSCDWFSSFIGFHTSKNLLNKGWRVVGVDCKSDYYDVSMKREREQILMQSTSYWPVHERVETENVLAIYLKRKS